MNKGKLYCRKNRRLIRDLLLISKYFTLFMPMIFFSLFPCILWECECVSMQFVSIHDSHGSKLCKRRTLFCTLEKHSVWCWFKRLISFEFGPNQRTNEHSCQNHWSVLIGLKKAHSKQSGIHTPHPHQHTCTKLKMTCQKQIQFHYERRCGTFGKSGFSRRMICCSIKSCRRSLILRIPSNFFPVAKVRMVVYNFCFIIVVDVAGDFFFVANGRDSNRLSIWWEFASVSQNLYK